MSMLTGGSIMSFDDNGGQRVRVLIKWNSLLLRTLFKVYSDLADFISGIISCVRIINRIVFIMTLMLKFCFVYFNSKSTKR